MLTLRLVSTGLDHEMRDPDPYKRVEASVFISKFRYKVSLKFTIILIIGAMNNIFRKEYQHWHHIGQNDTKEATSFFKKLINDYSSANYHNI